MTTTTPSARATNRPAGARLSKVTFVETKLLSRDFPTVFFGIVFPTLLLVGLGLIMPDFREVNEDLGGVRPVDVYSPVALTLAMITVAVVILPAYLSTYRGEGVLRRLATTPASPMTLLNAQLLVNLAILLLGSLLAFSAALLILDVEWPQNIGGTLVSFIIGAVACFSVGLLIAAKAKNGKSANAMGMVVYFPMLFFAGVWTPGDAMPDGVRAVADFTPTGAASEAMTTAWIDGDWPSALHLGVLAAWAIGAGFVASRIFRWE